MGKLEGMSSLILAVYNGGTNFVNFASYHTFKYLRTAAELESGRQSEYVALEEH